ncbi:DNA repair protein RadC [Lentisphaera araneosa HTCC2155]|uniref:DNA repair protein RadC n=1 Tax=Lentisphaera araneosa HTCC2155 TaxID=313628 RepID=A6DS55_9BACT|nr:DNA repair protein RadC [Lentisphaera araneosa]EDM25515.1 DNA repair protein RadC [Lentisphaera araneosa HTCC2155]
MNKKIKDLAEFDRPRERMLQLGEAQLSESELLALIIGSGTREQSALGLAREILAHFDNSVFRLSRATLEDLETIHGVGPAKATSLRAVFALARKLVAEEAMEQFTIHRPESAAPYLIQLLAGKSKEEFHILLLDTKNRLMRSSQISIGLLDRSHVHPREVFREALRYGTAKIILAHNHPSGDPSPSPQDIECTKNLIEAGEILGVKVVDHLIIGHKLPGDSRQFVSLRQLGLVDF